MRERGIIILVTGMSHSSLHRLHILQSLLEQHPEIAGLFAAPQVPGAPEDLDSLLANPPPRLLREIEHIHKIPKLLKDCLPNKPFPTFALPKIDARKINVPWHKITQRSLKAHASRDLRTVRSRRRNV